MSKEEIDILMETGRLEAPAYKGVTRSLVTEILSILYLLAFTQLNGWVRWIAFFMFVENLIESIVLSIKSRGKL